MLWHADNGRPARRRRYRQVRIPKAGDEIAYLGIDRIASDGTPYEAVKCFLTEESAEKFNDEKRPVTPVNLAYLKSFWEKPVIIEPHRNYWIEFL